jgi:hypothetical protein
MSRALHVAAHLGLILAGYVAASLAGALVLNVAVLAAPPKTSDPGLMVLGAGLLFSVPFTALFVAYFALLPAVLAVLAAEILQWRRWWYFAGTGTAAALSAILFMPRSGDDTPVGVGLVAVLSLAGAASGLVYWMVAGRRSGAWRNVTSPA